MAKISFQNTSRFDPDSAQQWLAGVPDEMQDPRARDLSELIECYRLWIDHTCRDPNRTWQFCRNSTILAGNCSRSRKKKEKKGMFSEVECVIML